MPDRVQAPAIKNPDDYIIKLPACESFNLKNGVPVYSVNGGTEDVLKIEWIFSAGKSANAKAGLASATNRLIKSGTTGHTSFELSQYFEFYGAFFSVGCFSEYAIISLEVLSKYLKEVLPLVAEILIDSIYPENEIEIYQQNSIQYLKVNLRKSGFVAGRELNAMLYGSEHPLGKKVDIEDIRNYSRESLTDFYNNYYRNGECKIFAAGKLPEDFQNLLDDYFGSLNINNKKNITLPLNVPGQEKKIHIENDANGVQTSVRVARKFPDKKHPDFKGAMVLNALFGGYFGSRLMSNIREDKGYTYGIYSYLQTFSRFGAWIITTDVGKDVTEPTIKEIYKEMDLLRKKPAGNEEMRLVKNYLIGHQLAALDGPFNIIDRWKGLILNNLDETFFYETIEAIKRISAKELQALAEKYFEPSEFYELTVL